MYNNYLKGIRVNRVVPGPVWKALEISCGQTQDKVTLFINISGTTWVQQMTVYDGFYWFMM
ncbi:hypothetical protein [Chryseobacterium sp. EO14]|uniref:hypothetical protein n=1 Tax=Chryseobacterium sp. EO14 TaxID=2950551 RepID=UPI00210E0A25|nr:hypothetical protein [Chryseobacterium sp. EO14]MCQ4139505.1 hypothetical protein [Chryseobacterium sp. EO14]